MSDYQYPHNESPQKGRHIKLISYSKTACGVDFLLNTADSSERLPWFNIAPIFNTDFFEFYFFRKGKGYVLLNGEKIDIKDGMVLIVSPYQQQEWHAEATDLDYTFLIFHEDFINNFFTDRYFLFRLLYCYQTERPSGFPMTRDEMKPFLDLLKRMKEELRNPISDSYQLIVVYLGEFLLLLNRLYARKFNLPLNLPSNTYAYQYKELLETHIRNYNRVTDYASMIGVSRIALNSAVIREFGVTANDLLKKRLLQEIKSEILFSGKPMKIISDELHFSAPNHLMRFFKAQTGKTVGQFLSEVKENGWQEI